MRRRPRPSPQILLALCGAGFLLFNFPLLLVWDSDATIFGLPLLPVAIFAIWAGLIAALALAGAPDDPPPEDQSDTGEDKG